MAFSTFRDFATAVTPRWLQGSVGGRYLYAMAIQFDALGEAMKAAVEVRYPGLYSDESLAYLGRERRIRRGVSEESSTYAKRLIRWLDDHRVRGNPYALLAQLYAYYAAAPLQMELVYYSGRRFSLDTSGKVTMDTIDWQPDANTAQWARWYLYIHWPTAINTDGTWGSGGTYGDGGVWGYDMTADEVASVKLVPQEWNAAHAIGTIVLLTPGSETWGYPPGTWGESGDVWGGTAPVVLPL